MGLVVVMRQWLATGFAADLGTDLGPAGGVGDAVAYASTMGTRMRFQEGKKVVKGASSTAPNWQATLKSPMGKFGNGTSNRKRPQGETSASGRSDRP